MKSKNHLLDFFTELSLDYALYEHEPLFTVEQASTVASGIPGNHIKNLFLKDDKKQLWLISARAHTKIELKRVSIALNAPKLRFADADLLLQYLGVEPGSVTPFALINDIYRKVNFVIDAELMAGDLINAHPLINDATVNMSLDNFKLFLNALSITPLVFDFNAYEENSL